MLEEVEGTVYFSERCYPHNITFYILELDSQKSFLPSGNSSILILPTVGEELFALHE